MSDITKEFFLDIEKNYDKKNDIERALYTCWSSGEDGYDRAGYEEQAYRGAAELADLQARLTAAEQVAKIDVLNELLREIDKSVYVEVYGYIENKRDALLGKVAK